MGQGAPITSYIPAQVPGLTNIIAISAGWFHILALKSDGTVWDWGNNSNGELGDGTSNNRSPVQVLNVSNIVVRRDGTVWKRGPERR